LFIKFITSNQSEKDDQNENQNKGEDIINDQNIGMQDEKDKENCNDREENYGTENNEGQDISMEDIDSSKKKVDSEDYFGVVNNEGIDMKYVNVVTNGDIGDNLNKNSTDFKSMDDPNKWSMIDDNLRLLNTM
jgi:hypothetical protein